MSLGKSIKRQCDKLSTCATKLCNNRRISEKSHPSTKPNILQAGISYTVQLSSIKLFRFASNRIVSPKTFIQIKFAIENLTFGLFPFGFCLFWRFSHVFSSKGLANPSRGGILVSDVGCSKDIAQNAFRWSLTLISKHLGAADELWNFCSGGEKKGEIFVKVADYIVFLMFYVFKDQVSQDPLEKLEGF